MPYPPPPILASLPTNHPLSIGVPDRRISTVATQPPSPGSIGQETANASIVAGGGAFEIFVANSNFLGDAQGPRTPSRPRAIRKKSGDSVRPVLRTDVPRYPSSAPPTPTVKAVRFDDSQLEQVRHFSKLEQPRAVSSVEDLAHVCTNTYTPGHGQAALPLESSPPTKLAVDLANFPTDTPARLARPVRLERVWLHSDQKMLLGSVAVANLSYHKHVACRFTFDGWETISEVQAYYCAPARASNTPNGYDCFVFSIDLADLIGIESKTMRCCVRYAVCGCDYWDNNENENFHVRFSETRATIPGRRIPSASRAMPQPPAAVGLPLTKDVIKMGEQSSAQAGAYDGPIMSGTIEERSHLMTRLTNLAISRMRAQTLSKLYDLDSSLSHAIRIGSPAMNRHHRRTSA